MAGAGNGLMVELAGVVKRYASAGGRDAQEVLKGIDLTVGEGQSVAIVGPSGSGKSTLLNIIGALDRATCGRVMVAGQDLSALDERGLAGLRNRQIGFVFQLHHLLPQLTVLENVLVPTLVNKDAAPAQSRRRAAELLERVELKEWSGYLPGELSGGQRQRVAVVRALINRPRLLLADEPTGSLDQASAENIADLLAELNRSDGLAMVVVTHSMKLARRMGSVMELTDGVLR